MLLRPASPGDFGAILALNEASVHFLSPLSPARLQHLHAQSALHLVAEEEGEVQAFLLAFREGADYDSVNYQWFARHDERFLYIDRVVVAEAARGRGVGRTLYEATFAFARQQRLPRVTCEFDIDPPNPVSELFHANFGFAEVGRQAVAGGTKQVSLQAAATGA
ncbi:GNAT family N-acetyltransferase [Ramlibacter sp. G-1-2-2]|uniref:GNAT family N-acetyltransferase n=1 Tax=Ramlibacter agri TaxID=2728837 RepID=A0A848HCJ1_9BURK|nr:GNAT family N-acetyltransferase [Ramlibacter agri]NML47199.1 GNAT family N-acetyltransferase [Ramlibacter agri]